MRYCHKPHLHFSSILWQFLTFLWTDFLISLLPMHFFFSTVPNLSTHYNSLLSSWELENLDHARIDEQCAKWWLSIVWIFPAPSYELSSSAEIVSNLRPSFIWRALCIVGCLKDWWLFACSHAGKMIWIPKIIAFIALHRKWNRTTVKWFLISACNRFLESLSEKEGIEDSDVADILFQIWSPLQTLWN